jgi:hypothetical protein
MDSSPLLPALTMEEHRYVFPDLGIEVSHRCPVAIPRKLAVALVCHLDLVC